MASRPRRAAAQRANATITDMAESSALGMSGRSRRSGGDSNNSRGFASVSRGAPSSSSPADSKEHIHLTVKMPSSKLREAAGSRGSRSTRGVSVHSRDNFVGGEIIAGKRNRGGKKSYVVESSEDDEDEEDEEEEIEDEIGVVAAADDDDEDDEDDEDMDDLGDEDAEGEVYEEADNMDVDAEGEDDDLGDDDAEGDADMDVTPAPPTIKISKPTKASSKQKATPSKGAGKASLALRNGADSDDEELSELESEPEESVQVGGLGGDEDAEGEDEEMEAEAEANEEEEELDSDEAGSRAETPDFSKMTKRQRARFQDSPQDYMKLSDEVQVKKHFTAEEISMRRAEMARRRRNLSEKRNEEVKMETINKLLKKQAPKTNKRNGQLGNETPDGNSQRADPVFVRWVSNKSGSRIAAPDEILDGPAGIVFAGPGQSGFRPGKIVEEVS